jgi:hypothetical protein
MSAFGRAEGFVGEFEGGYAQIRRAFIDHINEKDVDWAEGYAFLVMATIARYDTGTWMGSNGKLTDILHMPHAHTMKDALDGLEAKNYILRDYDANGYSRLYAIVIDKYPLYYKNDGVTKVEKRVDLAATKEALGIPKEPISKSARKPLRALIAKACRWPMIVTTIRDQSDVILSEVRSSSAPDPNLYVLKKGNNLTPKTEQEEANVETLPTTPPPEDLAAGEFSPSEEPSTTQPQPQPHAKEGEMLPTLTDAQRAAQQVNHLNQPSNRLAPPAQIPASAQTPTTKPSPVTTKAASPTTPAQYQDALKLAEYFETLRNNPDPDLDRGAYYLAPILASADLQTAKAVLDYLKADSDQFWWKALLQSGAPLFAKKFTDLRVAFNALRPQASAKALEASIDSMHCANQRFRSRASRLLSELEDAIAAGETDVTQRVTEVYDYAVKAHEGSIKTEAFRHSIAGASALKAAEALLLKVTAAYEAATGAAKSA